MSLSLESKLSKQSGQLSFIGGKPRLPVGKSIPSCKLCGASQTFFFQLAMPQGLIWEGSTLAVYQCTKCVDENHLIPEMVVTGLSGANIPAGFLEQYQKNFAFVVFPTNDGAVVSDYKESISFSEIQFIKGAAVGSFGKLGGEPNWLLEDESPSTYGENVQLVFLLEIVPNFPFKIIRNASPQMELDIMGEPSPSPLDYYQLFIGNALYLFGTSSGNKAVYAITQI